MAFMSMTYSAYAQQKPRGNVSAITGQKFKMKAKKLQKRKQINYINSIKLVAGLGTSNYFGDLCDGFDCAIPRPNMVVGVEYRLDESITLRAELNWVQLAGSDKGGDVYYRNLSFRANNFELSGVVQYDIFEYNKMYRRRHLLSPYVFAGVGITSNNPQAELDGEWYSLRKLQTEGNSYSPISFVLPYGAGVKLKINPMLNLTFEAGYRWSFTDYLDDVSGDYKDLNGVDKDSPEFKLTDRRKEYFLSLDKQEQLAIDADPGLRYNFKGEKQRGNSDNNDGYFLFQIKGEYTLKVTKQHYNINSNVNRFRVIKSIKKR